MLFTSLKPDLVATLAPHTPPKGNFSVFLWCLVADMFQYILWCFPVHGNPSTAAECVLIRLSDPSLQDFAHCPSCPRKHFWYEQDWGLGTCHQSHFPEEYTLAIKLKHPSWKCDRDCSQSILPVGLAAYTGFLAAWHRWSLSGKFPLLGHWGLTQD